MNSLFTLLAPVIPLLSFAPLVTSSETRIRDRGHPLTIERATTLTNPAAQVLDPNGPVETARVQLLQRRPSVTAIRFDENGSALFRMDVYFGSERTPDRDSLQTLLEQFRGGPSDVVAGATERDEEDLPDWMTVILPEAVFPTGESEMTYFDPQRNMAVAFRPLQYALSCGTTWYSTFNGAHSSGVTTWWYPNAADAVSAVTGSQRDRNSNPNLYLYRWTGSAWAYYSSSTSGNMLDHGYYNNSACSATYVAVGAYMSNGGDYCMRIARFNASL